MEVDLDNPDHTSIKIRQNNMTTILSFCYFKNTKIRPNLQSWNTHISMISVDISEALRYPLIYNDMSWDTQISMILVEKIYINFIMIFVISKVLR